MVRHELKHSPGSPGCSEVAGFVHDDGQDDGTLARGSAGEAFELLPGFEAFEVSAGLGLPARPRRVVGAVGMWSCDGILRPVINLVKVNIGAGILSMPLCFALLGPRAGIALLAFFGWIGWITVGLMSKVAVRTGARSLEEATEGLLGPRWARVLQLTMLLKCVGSMVAYLDVLGEVMTPLLPGWALRLPIYSRDPLSFRTVTIVIIGTGVLCPLSLMRSVNSLAPGAAACLVLAVTLVMLVAVEALELTPEDSAAHLASGGADAPVGSVLLSGGMMTYAFACQHMIFPIHCELSNEAEIAEVAADRFERLRRWTFLLVTVMYMLMGYCGLAAVGAGVDPDVMESLPSTAFTQLVSGLFSATLVFSYQFNVFAARPSSDALLYAKSRSDHSNPAIPDRPFAMQGWFLVGLTCFIAIIFPDIGMVFALTGSTTCTALMFFFPSALYYQSLPLDAPRRREQVVGLGLLVLVGGAVFLGATFAVLSGKKMSKH